MHLSQSSTSSTTTGRYLFAHSLLLFVHSRAHALDRVTRALAFAVLSRSLALNALLLFTLTLHSRFLSPVLQAEFLHPARFLLPALSCASRSHLQERPCPQGIGTIQKTAKRLQNDCIRIPYEYHTSTIRIRPCHPRSCVRRSCGMHPAHIPRGHSEAVRYVQCPCVPSLFM